MPRLIQIELILDPPLADLAADSKVRHKLSLANAFAAVPAREKKTELVTGDPEFKPLEKEIKINWLKEFP